MTHRSHRLLSSLHINIDRVLLIVSSNGSDNNDDDDDNIKQAIQMMTKRKMVAAAGDDDDDDAADANQSAKVMLQFFLLPFVFLSDAGPNDQE